MGGRINMTGRDIHDSKIDKETVAMLANMPEEVKGWYINLKASGRTAETIHDYIRKVRRFLDYVGGIDNITELNVSSYMVSIGKRTYSDGTVKSTSDSYRCTVWSCLNNFLSYLERNGYIKRNYMEDITRPHNNDLDRINENRVRLNAEDFHSILSSVNFTKDPEKRVYEKAVLVTLMSTGMRETALCNIMLDDIDMENRKLYVIDKGNKRHTYVINDATYDAISEWMKNRRSYNGDRHLFLYRNGQPINGKEVSRIVRKYTKKALGKPLSPHKIRSGFCTILYDKTHDIEFVRRAVGHSNVKITQRYVVTDNREREESAKMINSIF